MNSTTYATPPRAAHLAIPDGLVDTGAAVLIASSIPSGRGESSDAGCHNKSRIAHMIAVVQSADLPLDMERTVVLACSPVAL
jgi:hypothetical protein